MGIKTAITLYVLAGLLVSVFVLFFVMSSNNLAVFQEKNIGMIQYSGSLRDEAWYNEANPKPVLSHTTIIDRYTFKTFTKDFGTVLGEPFCSEFLDLNPVDAIRAKFSMPGCSQGGFAGRTCCDSRNPNDRCITINNEQTFVDSSLCDTKTFSWVYEECPGGFFVHSSGAQVCWNGWQNAQTGSEQIGGITQTVLYSNPSTRTCFQKIEIYENDELIQTLDWDSNAYQGANRRVDLDGVRASFMYAARSTTNGCIWVANTYSFKIPDNAFTFIIEGTQSKLIVGQEITTRINVINNWKDVKGELCVTYNIPYTTIFGDRETDDVFCKVLDIPKGESSLLYELPTTRVTDIVKITPNLEVLIEGSDFSGVNGYCYGNNEGFVRDLGACSFVSVGTLSGDTNIVEITTESAILREQLLQKELDIIELKRTIEEKASYIKQLNINLEDMLLIVDNLNLKAAELTDLIDKLELNLQEKALFIVELTSLKDEQAQMINDLTDNLQEKADLLALITAENEEQAELLKKMNLSFSDQAIVLDALNLKIEDDAIIIKNFKYSIDDNAALLKEFKLKVDEYAIIISRLELTIDEMIELANKLELKNEDNLELITKLEALIGEQIEPVGFWSNVLNILASIWNLILSLFGG